MAKKKKEQFNYREQITALKRDGAQRLYLLWGEEEYLRERFLGEIKALCVDPEFEEFNFHRISGDSFDTAKLEQALRAIPFFGGGVLVEVRGLDLNKCRDSLLDELKRLLSDIPDYCTLVFIPGAGYEPDGRLAVTKLFKQLGTVIEFTVQSQTLLLKWISQRFAAFGKLIGKEEAEYLVFNCGSLMNNLILEIEKVAAYCPGETISKSDIDAVTTRTPEANIFNMTDDLAAGRYDSAARILSELLGNREEPIMILAIIGQQMRRLFVARSALDSGAGAKYVMDVCEIRYDFIVKKLMDSARVYSPAALALAVGYCAEADYAMKSGGDGSELLKELLLRLALDEAHA